MMKKLIPTLVLCMLIWLAGCAASSPPTHFYMLNSVAAPPAAARSNYAVSVGPVFVPALIDRQQIVTCTGPNQVFIDEYERWAAPLKDSIGRVVARDLIALLGTGNVTIFPESSAANAAYRTAIDIMRFDGEFGKSATLEAYWTVSSAGGQTQRGRTQVIELTQGSGYPALVAAQSRALGKLSADIAGAIKAMEARKP